jgi:hypothetical protein
MIPFGADLRQAHPNPARDHEGEHRECREHARWRPPSCGKIESGLFIVPQRSPIGEVIESLVLVWTASQSAEWRNTVVYLPFR